MYNVNFDFFSQNFQMFRPFYSENKNVSCIIAVKISRLNLPVGVTGVVAVVLTGVFEFPFKDRFRDSGPFCGWSLQLPKPSSSVVPPVDLLFL